jgi:hypothetical protein
MAALAEFYPAYRAIERAEPDTYRRMRGIVEAELAKGTAGREINARLQAEIRDLYLRRLPTAPDELILAYGRFMVDALVYLEKHDVQACRSLVTSGPAGSYGPELNNRDSDILSRVVTAPSVQRPFATEKEAAAASQRALREAAQTLHQPVDRLLAAFAGDGTPEEVCAAARAYFAEVLRTTATKPATLRTLLFK